MQASRYFFTKVTQIEKQARSDAAFDKEQALANCFAKVIGLPKEMAHELYDTFGSDIDKLLAVIDFFENDLTRDDAAALNLEEWQSILDLINRFGHELDIELLQPLMQFLLDLAIL